MVEKKADSKLVAVAITPAEAKVDEAVKAGMLKLNEFEKSVVADVEKARKAGQEPLLGKLEILDLIASRIRAKK